MATDLFEALKNFSKADSEAGEDYLKRLKGELDAALTTVSGPQEAANLHRVCLGVALLDARPAKGVGAWVKKQAEVLGFGGKGGRSIRELVGVAEALRAAQNNANGVARSVPMVLVQRPWADVRRAVRTFSVTGDVDGQVAKVAATDDQKKERALRAVTSALRRAAKIVPASELQALVNDSLAAGTMPRAKGNVPPSRRNGPAASSVKADLSAAGVGRLADGAAEANDAGSDDGAWSFLDSAPLPPPPELPPYDRSSDPILEHFLVPRAELPLTDLLPLAERLTAYYTPKGMTRPALAKEFQCGEAKIANLLRLTELPQDVKDAVARDEPPFSEWSLAAAVKSIRTPRGNGPLGSSPDEPIFLQVTAEED